MTTISKFEPLEAFLCRQHSKDFYSGVSFYPRRIQTGKYIAIPTFDLAAYKSGTTCRSCRDLVFLEVTSSQRRDKTLRPWLEDQRRAAGSGIPRAPLHLPLWMTSPADFPLFDPPVALLLFAYRQPNCCKDYDL